LRAITLKRNERIIAAIPRTLSGDRWSSKVVWVYVFDPDTSKVRIETLHEDELPETLKAYFAVGEVVCNALVEMIPVEKR